jgi:transcriptional regulator with XRE-family HTH domain
MGNSDPAVSPLFVEVAAVLRGALAAEGIGRAELAERSEIPERTLRTYLKGQVEMKVGKLDAVAKVLGFASASDVLRDAEQRLEKARGRDA